MKLSSAVLSICLLLPTLLAAQSADKLTMLEGSLRIIRGANVYKADRSAEGMVVRQGDMIESSDGGFAQFEFGGGTVVALGPSSKVFLARLAGGHRGGAAPGQPVANLILLSGWLKAESNPASGTYRYSTSLFSLAAASASILIHLDADGCDAYVESGSATVGEPSSEIAWRQTGTAKGGQFFSRKSGKNMATLARPSPSFVDTMPVPFQDTLPPRSSRFEGKKPPEPKSDHPVTFADLQPWFALSAGWRKSFVERFEPRLTDASFRAQIEAHLAQYPEWDPILHPEKYEQENSVKKSEKP
jgi:hypothetical protein